MPNRIRTSVWSYISNYTYAMTFVGIVVAVAQIVYVVKYEGSPWLALAYIALAIAGIGYMWAVKMALDDVGQFVPAHRAESPTRCPSRPDGKHIFDFGSKLCTYCHQAVDIDTTFCTTCGEATSHINGVCQRCYVAKGERA